MLKYLNYDIVFQEVPFEMSLAVSISGCVIRCKGCHSRHLWEDKGDELSIFAIEQLLKKEDGVTCLLLMGGEHDIDTLVEIFMHFHRKIKTAWYCGLDMIPKDKLGIVQYLDFLKVGHFDMELGGLSSPTTNQRLYKIEHQGDGNYYQTDITHLMQKK
jgi:anaerobic ribonucleoside-triphosphate reductase activating protein